MAAGLAICFKFYEGEGKKVEVGSIADFQETSRKAFLALALGLETLGDLSTAQGRLEPFKIFGRLMEKCMRTVEPAIRTGQLPVLPAMQGTSKPLSATDMVTVGLSLTANTSFTSYYVQKASLAFIWQRSLLLGR
jgi:hypothetical protein